MQTIGLYFFEKKSEANEIYLVNSLFCSFHWSVPSNVNGTSTYLENGNRVTDIENKIMVTMG